MKQRLGGYVKLSIEERRQAAMELAAEGHSQRQIGKVLGVGKSTVNDDLAVQNRTIDNGKPAQTQGHVTEIVQEWTPEPLDVLSNLAVTEAAREAALEKAKREERKAGENLETQNLYAEAKLRCEREAGAILAVHIRKGGDRKSKYHDDTLRRRQTREGFRTSASAHSCVPGGLPSKSGSS